MVRYLVLILILILPLYPCVELTRIIIVNGWTIWPQETGLFKAEIAVIWTLWILIIPVYLSFTRPRVR